MFKNNLTIKNFILGACALLMGGTLQAVEENTPTTIDILYVFDAGACEKLGSIGQRRNFVNRSSADIAEESIQQLNHLMSNSGLREDVRFRCCGIFHADYRSQAGTNGEKLSFDLRTLTTGQADAAGTPMTGNLLSRKNESSRIMTLREAEEFSHADLVIMLVDYNIARGPCCLGLAAAGRYNSLYLNIDRQKGRYSVFRMNTENNGDFTMSHEICHLFGAGHSDYQSYQRGPQAETDAAGTYADEAGTPIATLMSYDSAGLDLRASTPTQLRARNELILSNPRPRTVTRRGRRVTYNVGDEDSHNNAAALQRAASTVSMYSICGNEEVLNDNFSRAIALPPLKPLEDKIRMALESQYSGNIEEDALRENWSTRWDRTSNIFIRTALTSGGTNLISPEFDQKNSVAGSLVSCVLGTNLTATRENGEPEMEGAIGQTVWYSVTPPVSGKMTIGIRTLYSSHSFQPVLGVFRGESVQTLEALPHTVYTDERDNRYYKHRIQVDVRQGEKLYIAVDSSTNTGRGFNLLVSLKEDPTLAAVVPPATPKSEAENQPAAHASIVSDEELTVEQATATAPQAAPTTEAQENAVDAAPAETAVSEQNEASAEAPTTESPTQKKKKWDTTDSVLLAIAVGFMLATILTCCNLLSAGFSSSTNNNPGTDKEPKADEDEENDDIYDAYTSIPVISATNDKLKLIGKLSTNEKVEYTIKVQDIADKGNFYIGRAETCDLVIPDSTISRCHAVFKVRSAEAGYVILIGDAGSTNGTIIDDIRLTQNQSLKVQKDTRVNIGSCSFTISIL